TTGRAPEHERLRWDFGLAEELCRYLMKVVVGRSRWCPNIIPGGSRMRLQQRPSSRWIVWVALVWLVVGSFGAVEAAGVDMMLWVSSWPQAGIDAIQRAAGLFAERHPEVNSVTVQPVSQSELLERLAVAVAGGSPPDAIALAAPLAQPALGGLLMPLNRFIEQSAVVDRADYPPFMLESLSFEGQEY